MMLAIVAGVGLVLAGGSKLAWEHGMGGLSRPAQLWEKTRRLARWSKAGAPETETPREFARRLSGKVERPDDVVYLAAAYERTAFGGKQLRDDEAAELESAWVSVRNGLLRRLVRRR